MAEIYQIGDIHPNSKRVLQVCPIEQHHDLAEKLLDLTKIRTSTAELEPRMWTFFQREVVPQLAYSDNDVSQGEGGPQRIWVGGKLYQYEEEDEHEILTARLSTIGSLIPSLQILYWNDGHTCSGNQSAWSYEYTNRYGPRVTGAKLENMAAITSFALIPAIIDAIAKEEPLKIPEVLTV